MHPILTHPRYLLFYLIAWAPLASLIGLTLSFSAHLSWRETVWIIVPVTIFLAFLCLTPLYMCRALPVGSTAPFKLFGNHLFAALAILVLIHPLIWMDVRAGDRFFPNLGEKLIAGMPLLTVSTLLIYLIAVGSHYAGLALESSRKAQLLARDAELRALKAQVNPHFLFNSLNSISALTSIDASRAREMCVTLSDFLRLSLRLGERQSIPFQEELEVARTYLSVEQTRFGNRLRVVEQMESACGACEIPPLLMQPLLENAIKHGIANLIDGGEIAMRGSCDGHALRFSIENQFDPDAPLARKSGIGLKNVRDRLQARYGGAAGLEIEVQENRYRVTLHLPCERAPGEARSSA